MDARVLIGIIVALVVIIALAVVYSRRRRSAQLKQKFGPEYDRLVQQHGDPSRAETVLEKREKRVESFKIHSLPAAERESYAREWAAVQSRFVDDPRGAVTEGDALLTRVMSARGYPMGDFSQRYEDISVNYPTLVQNYRAAHDIVLRHEKGEASTEDLRQAMVHYRSLFDELLEVNTTGVNTPGRKEVA